MLQELRIANFLLIRAASVRLDPGLNVLTGESGAGKSIAVQAIKWLLGSAPATDPVGPFGDSTTVEGRFVVKGETPAFRAIVQLLEDRGLTASVDMPEELILRRVSKRGGRTKSYLNDAAITQNTLSELGEWLFDATLQDAHIGLLRPARQISLLDATVCDLAPLKGTYEQALDTLHRLARQKRDIESRQEALRRDEDYIRYQLKELEKIALSPDSETALIAQKEALKARAGWQDLGDRARELLDGGPHAASSALNTLLRELERREPLEAPAQEAAEQLKTALSHLEDGSRLLFKYLRHFDGGEAELEKIESQLSVLKHLQRKFRLSIPELAAQQASWQADIAWLDGADAAIRALEPELAKGREVLAQTATALTAARKQAALALSQKIVGILHKLGMKDARFSIDVAPRPLDEWESWSSEGADAVCFMFSGTRGQAEKPLSQVASGGERSRLLFALKAATPALQAGISHLFDEIDAGIGGETADRLGALLAEMGEHCQITVITHLPQVARHGHAHFLIEKENGAVSSETRISPLSHSEKTAEFSRMLGGTRLSGKTQELAKDLLRAG